MAISGYVWHSNSVILCIGQGSEGLGIVTSYPLQVSSRLNSTLVQQLPNTNLRHTQWQCLMTLGSIPTSWFCILDKMVREWKFSLLTQNHWVFFKICHMDLSQWYFDGLHITYLPILSIFIQEVKSECLNIGFFPYNYECRPSKQVWMASRQHYWLELDLRLSKVSWVWLWTSHVCDSCYDPRWHSTGGFFWGGGDSCWLWRELRIWMTLTIMKKRWFFNENQ